MIPHLVTVGYRRPGDRRLRLCIPVLPVLLVLSPLLLLAVLAGLAACLATGVSPVGALRGTGQLLRALPGTRIEIGGRAAGGRGRSTRTRRSRSVRPGHRAPRRNPSKTQHEIAGQSLAVTILPGS